MKHFESTDGNFREAEEWLELARSLIEPEHPTGEIEAYCEGRLSGEREQVVRFHLACCDRCRPILEAQRRADDWWEKNCEGKQEVIILCDGPVRLPVRAKIPLELVSDEEDEENDVCALPGDVRIWGDDRLRLWAREESDHLIIVAIVASPPVPGDLQVTDMETLEPVSVQRADRQGDTRFDLGRTKPLVGRRLRMQIEHGGRIIDLREIILEERD